MDTSSTDDERDNGATESGSATIALADPAMSTTQHGHVTWYTYLTAPTAAQRSLQDLSSFVAMAAPATGAESEEGMIGSIFNAIGIGAQIVGAVAQAGRLGLDVADTARSYQNPPPNSDSSVCQQGVVTIGISNNSLAPLAFSSVKTSACELSQSSIALTTGQSGSILLTRDMADMDSNSQATIGMVIGSSPGASVPITLNFNYSETYQVWSLSADVDDSGYTSFPKATALSGCAFAPFSEIADTYPNFSIYCTTCQSPSGSIQVVIYPNSDAA